MKFMRASKMHGSELENNGRIRILSKGPGRMYGSCLRKRVYRTYNYALSEAERLGKQNGVELFVYWCPYCHNYHLTKTKQK